MGKPIRIISWNVNGIRAMIKKDFYNTVRGFKADILCMQETKAQEDTMPALQAEMEGYDFIFNSAVQKGYSGTAVLSRIRPLKHWFDTGAEEHGQEGRVITLEYESFFLVNVYVPNSGEGLRRLGYRKEWDDHLTKYVAGLDAKKPVILTGDLNVAHEAIDLARPEQNYNKTAGYTQVEIDGFRNFLQLGMVDTYRRLNGNRIQYSYWSARIRARESNLGWRIDYFLVSERLFGKVKEAFIWDQIQGSDHCPVGIDMEV